ncbi:MAG: hypothetical protein IKP73_21155, partial [Bacteroidales bacterium]|nr:hypothetical protein [Bacteroidales bacterium]
TANSQWADLVGHIGYDKAHHEIFNFGKHKGKKVVDVIGYQEPQYYDWIMKNDFALNTKQVLTQIKLRIAQNRMNGGR